VPTKRVGSGDSSVRHCGRAKPTGVRGFERQCIMWSTPARASSNASESLNIRESEGAELSYSRRREEKLDNVKIRATWTQPIDQRKVCL
jgi:hypothetical protein